MCGEGGRKTSPINGGRQEGKKREGHTATPGKESYREARTPDRALKEKEYSTKKTCEENE